MFEKVSRSLKYDSNIFFVHKHIYIWTPQPITLPRSRCTCGVINSQGPHFSPRSTAKTNGKSTNLRKNGILQENPYEEVDDDDDENDNYRINRKIRCFFTGARN